MSIYLPHVHASKPAVQPAQVPAARRWCNQIMWRYHFREDARLLINRHCEYRILDWHSKDGGGCFDWDKSPPMIVLNSRQDEACVHECAHAWWYCMEQERTDKDALVALLVTAFLVESEQPRDEYGDVRRLCRKYRWGDETECQWLGEPYNRWNHDEIFAGLASGTMGDMSRMPPTLRRVFAGCFYAA